MEIEEGGDDSDLDGIVEELDMEEDIEEGARGGVGVNEEEDQTYVGSGAVQGDEESGGRVDGDAGENGDARDDEALLTKRGRRGAASKSTRRTRASGTRTKVRPTNKTLYCVVSCVKRVILLGQP